MEEERESRRFRIRDQRSREDFASETSVPNLNPKAIEANTIVNSEITTTPTTTEQTPANEQNSTSSIPSPIEEQEDNEEEREAEVSSKEMRDWRRSVANKNKIRYYVESDEIDG